MYILYIYKFNITSRNNNNNNNNNNIIIIIIIIKNNSAKSCGEQIKIFSCDSQENGCYLENDRLKRI